MIKIQNDITTATIEDYYKKIFSSRAKNYVDIQLPMNPKFSGFGALSSFFQFLITWRRLENCGRLIIDVKDISDASEIESTIKQYYGFIASVLAWDLGIINKNGRDIKNQFRQQNAQLNELLVKGRFDLASRGDSILFPFFDHLESARGLLPIIYKNGILQNEDEFENVTDKIVDITTKNNAILKKSFKSIIKDMNGILYELFDNTNKWAKHSISGKVYTPGVRGIYSRFYKLDPQEDDLKAYTNSSGLKKYFKKVLLKGDGQKSYYKYINFLELSVFDSGAGLAQRFERKEVDQMTREEEYKSLLKCLQKHTTSHNDHGEFESRGLGLHRIMELLDEKEGFLKVRAGRMYLYRDFSNHPLYPSKTSSPNSFMLDWETDTTSPASRQKVEGTLITILIPIAQTASRQ